MTATEYRAKNAADLKKELEALYKEEFSLRMQQSTRQLQKTHLLKIVKRNIARVKTILNEKADDKS